MNTLRKESPLQPLIESMDYLYNKPHELAAIWVGIPVQTETERTCRLTAGHKIRLEDECVVDVCEGNPATHRIIKTVGTMYSNFSLELIDLKTLEPSILKI